MGEPHVVSALRQRRVELSGHIIELEKRLAQERESLASLDATIKQFAPNSNPREIPPKRRYKRVDYFRDYELSRLVLDALRRNGKE